MESAEVTPAPSPYFPMPRAAGCPMDPAPELARIRDEQPIRRITLWDGSQPWFVTRYDEVRAVLSDVRFSSDAAQPGFPNETAALAAHREHDPMLLTMDPPEHTALRRMMTRNFMVRRLEAMRPQIQEIVDGLIDDMLEVGPPADLGEAFAVPLPVLAVSALLGVPPEDSHIFTRLLETMNEIDATSEDARAANAGYAEYIDGLISEKARNPGDDLLSRLYHDHVVTGELSRADLIANARLLLVAGFESTANQLGLSVLLLLQHPDQLAALRGDPSLVPGAVEETLRYATIDHFGRRRLATADMEIGGQLIRAGEGVVVSQATANRDPAAFEEPNRFDITRDARHHLAFSYGVHQCLGQTLARIELQVALSTLFARIPTLQLAVALEEIPFKHEKALYGVHKLLVTWTPSPSAS